MSEQNKAVVRRIMDEHWNNKNAAIVSELFASNVSLDTPDGLLTGLEGAGSLLQAYEAAFPDFHNTTDDLFAEGDQVVVRWTFTGTNSGPFGDIAATGKQVRVPGCIGIFQLDGGKVNQGHMAWDKYSLFQQLGVIPSSTSKSAEASA
jgi:predicted ester cyclase